MHGTFGQVLVPAAKSMVSRPVSRPSPGWNVVRDWLLVSESTAHYKLNNLTATARYKSMDARELRDALHCLAIIVEETTDRLGMPAMNALTAILKKHCDIHPGIVRHSVKTIWQNWENRPDSELRNRAQRLMWKSWRGMLPQKPDQGYGYSTLSMGGQFHPQVPRAIRPTLRAGRKTAAAFLQAIAAE